MTIWRGAGGGGDATTDSEINFITSLTNSIAADTATTTAAATATADLYDSFDDRYLGSKAAAPTLDNDGNALISGALYWNSVSNQMFVWSGIAWQQTFFSGTNVRSVVTATAGQTVITTPSYTQGNNTIQVYVNGFKVISGTDYTETSTTSITFTSGLTLGDEVEIIIAQPFSVGITSSDAVNYLPGGTGAIATTIQAKLREQVSVKDFGAVGNGIANDTAAIQAAINYAGNKLGGTVFLPAGSYKLTSTLSCLFPNVLLEGEGSSGNHNTGDQGIDSATKLVWAGSSGGTMLLIGSVDGVSNVKYSGGGVRSIFFNSGATTNGTGASYGIDIVSYDQGVFENVMFKEFQNKGIRLRCTLNLFDARDPQHNRFLNCWSRNFVNQDGGLFLLEGDTAMFSGSGSGGTYVLANVSLNHFENCGVIFYNGIAYELKNSDHNFFINCRANRVTGGTGQGIVFQGSNQRNTAATLGTESSDFAFVARKNVFIGFSGGSDLIARGTTSYTYASYKNIFMMLDDSNNTPFPTIETDALCYVSMRTNGVQYYNNVIVPINVNAGTLAGAETLALESRKRVTTESLRVENGGSDGIRIARPATDSLSVTSEFAIAPVGTSLNLRFARITGTGVVQMATGVGYNVNNVGSITLTNLNTVVLIDATAASRTITLPLANAYGANVSGQLSIRRIDASANTVTIQRQSTDTLNGTTSELLTNATSAATVTTLNGAIDSVVTSIVLTNATGFDSSGLVRVDSEVISYSGISTNTLTGCTRGVNGTTAASHSTLANVAIVRSNYGKTYVCDGTSAWYSF